MLSQSNTRQNTYFSERKWAEAFLDGEVLFRSLAYFRDYEDENVRKDKGEGNSIYKPAEGLLVTNQTQGKTLTLPGYAFEATANQEEIFVFCTSRSLNDELRKRFEATVCVEILKIPTFCERVRRALPVRRTGMQERSNTTMRVKAPVRVGRFPT